MEHGVSCVLLDCGCREWVRSCVEGVRGETPGRRGLCRHAHGSCAACAGPCMQFILQSMLFVMACCLMLGVCVVFGLSRCTHSPPSLRVASVCASQIAQLQYIASISVFLQQFMM